MNVEFLSEIRSRVRWAMRRTGGPVAEDDAVQEASLRVWKALTTKNVQNPGGLMNKIVRDAVRDHLRGVCRHRRETALEDSITAIPAAEERMDHARRLSLLQDAVWQLDCDHRGPIYLFYFEGFTIRQLARIYKKSPAAMKMVLSRGRRQLRAIVGASPKKSRG